MLNSKKVDKAQAATSTDTCTDQSIRNRNGSHNSSSTVQNNIFASPSDIDYERFLTNVRLAMSDKYQYEWIIPPLQAKVGQQLNDDECKIHKDITGLVLIMIVKNESEIIRRCLDSTKGIVDAICITDTNSDRPSENKKIDKYCPDIIKNWAKENEIPCEVPIHYFTRETFQFDFARTLSFVNGCKYFPNAKYFITIDADMELIKTGDFDINKLNADSYMIYQQTSHSRYQNLRIIKNNTLSRVRGATHEYWQVRKNVNGQVMEGSKETLHDLEIKDNDDGKCKDDKYIRDKYLLERDFLRKSTSKDLRTRYLFYLAQTYMCLHKNDKAIDFYQERFLAGGWIEERWYSLFQIGQLRIRQYDELLHRWKLLEWELTNKKNNGNSSTSKDLKQLSSLNNLDVASYVFDLYNDIKESQKKVVRAMLAAYEFRPTRAEPLYYLAKMYREEGNNEMSMYYALKAQKVGYPINDSLFVDIKVYNYLILFEISICGYYVQGYYQIGVDAQRKLKLMYHILPNYIQRVVDNNDEYYKC